MWLINAFWRRRRQGARANIITSFKAWSELTIFITNPISDIPGLPTNSPILSYHGLGELCADKAKLHSVMSVLGVGQQVMAAATAVRSTSPTNYYPSTPSLITPPPLGHRPRAPWRAPVQKVMKFYRVSLCLVGKEPQVCRDRATSPGLRLNWASVYT